MHLSFHTLRPLGLSVLIASLTFAASISEAARVSKVGGGKVLIDGSGSDVELTEGSRYVVIVGGKRKAIVQLTQVKGTKAVGKILKGKPEVDGTLQAVGGGSTSASSSSSSGSKKLKGGSIFNDITFGAIGGFAMDSQSVTATNTTNTVTETISMSGYGYSLKAFGDMPISGPLGVIGRAGIEQFNVNGTASFGNVKTSIMYATVDLLLRYFFMEGDFVPFAGVGLGIHFPLSKTSDVLDVQRVSSTSVFILSGGLNYKLSNDMYVTGMAEYGYFPPSNEVKTSMISLRGGVGFRF